MKGLHHVQSATQGKLLRAMEARRDETHERLRNDILSDDWLSDKAPKWHEKCRNWYINENLQTG